MAADEVVAIIRHMDKDISRIQHKTKMKQLLTALTYFYLHQYTK